jgi:hypothetical protein
MVVPLLAIPMFAVMGVPQFAPLVASPGADPGFVESWSLREPAARTAAPRFVAATAPVVADKTGIGESARCSLDDLFAPYNASPSPTTAGLSLETDRQPARARNGMPVPVDHASASGSRRAAFDDANAVLAGSAAYALPDEALEGFAALPNRGGANSLPAATASGSRPKHAGGGFATENPHTEPTNAPLRRFDREPDFTWEQAVQRLKSLGIKKYHLESLLEEGGFSFRCSYTAPDNPRVTRRFEAEAPEPLAAVRIVLDQIEAWRVGP